MIIFLWKNLTGFWIGSASVIAYLESGVAHRAGRRGSSRDQQIILADPGKASGPVKVGEECENRGRQDKQGKK